MKFMVFITVLSIVTTGGGCAPQQPPPGTLASTSTTKTGECIDGHRWQQGCNDCVCLSGHQACTTNICVPHTITIPTSRPTTRLTPRPTTAPTTRPTARPTPRPTTKPTSRPTTTPTPRPTTKPTSRPTTTPTPRPTPPRTTSSSPGDVRPRVAVSGLALWEAAEAGEVSAVVAQLAAGADVNWRIHYQDHDRPAYQDGFTPLHIAARYNHADVVRVLIDAKADINRPDYDGYTPIAMASARGSSSALGLLISHGGNVNRSGKYGHTPLHFAALHNYPGIVQQLLAAGADTTSRDKDGATPGDWARDQGYSNLGATIDNYSPPSALGPLTTA